MKFMNMSSVPIEAESCCSPLLQAPLDEVQAAELAEVLKALADPVP